MILQLPAIAWGQDVIDGSLLKSASLVSDLIAEQIDISTEEINELMSMIDNIQNLDEETIQKIQKELAEYGITQSQIDQIFESLE